MTTPRLTLALLLPALLAPLLLAAGDETPLTVGHHARSPGERFEVSSVAEVKLQAEIGTGFLAQRVSYDLREEERLEVTVLEAAEDSQRRVQLSYPLRRGTTTAPLVGRKTKDRRVANKTYVVAESEAGLDVRDAAGEASTREKEARYVRASWASLELEPALHLLLEDGTLTPGQELVAPVDVARRLLGLPLEQLAPDALTLTVVGPATDGSIELRLVAQLSGAADVAGHDVRLTAELSGPLFIDAASGRTLKLELSGTTKIVADADDGLLSARGEGTLTLRRMLRELDE
ncbi:MAG: hypothetical protein DRQ55_09835 [Planctomycetota bacterium]|nr:MAG: hypothetical protein DRQ55_09835 [Planctomycetota bacterium]